MRKGQSFRRWQARLLNLGYEVQARELRACDFGAPTSRRRLFIIARCDGQPITWPEATHGPGRAAPYRTAAECIDWSIPCPSIFGRKKPLADATQRRIARGIVRYVVNSAAPFIVPITHAGGDRVHGADEPLRTVTCAPRGEFALISPALVQMGHGEREGQAPPRQGRPETGRASPASGPAAPLTLMRWESGRCFPGVDDVERLAKELQRSPGALVRWAGFYVD